VVRAQLFQFLPLRSEHQHLQSNLVPIIGFCSSSFGLSSANNHSAIAYCSVLIYGPHRAVNYHIFALKVRNFIRDQMSVGDILRKSELCVISHESAPYVYQTKMCVFIDCNKQKIGVRINYVRSH